MLAGGVLLPQVARLVSAAHPGTRTTSGCMSIWWALSKPQDSRGRGLRATS
ncbi:hypothetical protein XCR_3073 [Xanthomonas campestris pv. raphani 756C]|nr:hypothetical protein XCR_3073 [Xanthomonas campestris pv. raphani 756C]